MGSWRCRAKKDLLSHGLEEAQTGVATRSCWSLWSPPRSRWFCSAPWFFSLRWAGLDMGYTNVPPHDHMAILWERGADDKLLVSDKPQQFFFWRWKLVWTTVAWPHRAAACATTMIGSCSRHPYEGVDGVLISTKSLLQSFTDMQMMIILNDGNLQK